MKCNLSKDITPILNRYVTLDTEQTITGRKVFSRDLYLKMSMDTSNAVVYAWRNTDDTKTIAAVQCHNTAQRITLNAIGANELYKNELGKYSFIVGNNELTYNTYPILHAGNLSQYLNSSAIKQ